MRRGWRAVVAASRVVRVPVQLCVLLHIERRGGGVQEQQHTQAALF